MLSDIAKRLAEQLDAAQSTLHELRLASGCDTFPSAVLQPEKRYEIAYRAAVRSFENRRLRAGYFSSHDIFGEPAWDILLDIYIHQFQNEEVNVKNASVGSGARASTKARWLQVLEDQNLISLAQNSADLRSRFIRLTPKGFEIMTRYLNDIAR
jgi:DNA-binding MarR family transcriptional regulator